jgi:hypothetical protein
VKELSEEGARYGEEILQADIVADLIRRLAEVKALTRGFSRRACGGRTT